MARTVPTGLQPLLDLPSCETHTTLDLTLADTTEIHVATSAFTVAGRTYTADLRKSNELKQTVQTPPDRGTVIIQNVDKVFGGYVADEDLIKAVAVIGRYYKDPSGVLTAKWVELFRGEAFPLGINESEVQIEVLGDMIAAGYCVADETLAEPCQWIFKDADTCGYSGVETACNKKRKSKSGCFGRQNMHRFGGMEYPDIQIPSPAISGGDPGGGHHTCPTLDQFVLIKSMSGTPLPCRVAWLDARIHELYNPVSNTFHKIRSATVVEGEPIWRVEAANGAACSSSFTHLVLWYRQHETGEQVRNIIDGDPILTWSKGMVDSRVTQSRHTGDFANVMKIEMVDGHIYAVGETVDNFIVSHNSKEPLEP